MCRFVSRIFGLHPMQGTDKPTIYLFSIVRDILASDDSEKESDHLPGSVLVFGRHRPFKVPRVAVQIVDSHRRRSWLAKPLLFLLVKRNYKLCQILWPTLTKLLYSRTRFKETWDFGPMPSENAVAEDTIADTSTAMN